MAHAEVDSQGTPTTLRLESGWHTSLDAAALPWPDPAFEVPAIADDEWELYAPDDWTQAKNIAAEQPEKLAELQQRFLIEGTKYNVLPLDDRMRVRYNAELAGRPDLMLGRTTLTLYPGMTRLNENTVLNLKNRSFAVTASITCDDEAKGAVIAQGGGFGGWSVYFHEGKLTYAHNFVGLDLYKVRAEIALSAGKHEIEVRFVYDGDGVGKGGTAVLLADGKQIGQGRIERTVPAMFSLDEGTDVGLDTLDPVVEDYGTPQGRFTGTIDWVKLDTSEDVHEDADLVIKARMRKH